ncbi:MAG: mechanosensitive ion channel [Hyphomonadaceae bacterium]
MQADWAAFALELTRSRWLVASVAIVVIFAISAWLIAYASKHIDDAGRRHGARKLIRFLTFALAAVILVVAVGPNLPTLGVFLGVAGAGVAFALQEVIASIAGWLAILGGGFYRTGDRVMLGGIKGDVIEIGVLRTTLMEIGEWVEGDNYSGRIVRIANSFVFKEPVFNYSADFHFVWEELKLPIRYGSDIERAEAIVLDAVRAELGEIGESSRTEWARLVRKYLLEDARLDPWASIKLTDNWIELSARFIVDYRRRRSAKDAISRRVLKAIEASGGKVRLASATMELTVQQANPAS